jgi:phosphohistidine phosphatase
MNVYLVQHGKAEDDVLTSRGLSEVREVAMFMRPNISVDSIVHSVKRRAKETAEVFDFMLSPINGIREVKGLKPMDDPTIWTDNIDKETKNIMLIGHLPHLNKLAENLLDLQILFQNGGIVCLERDDDWYYRVSWAVVPEIV